MNLTTLEQADKDATSSATSAETPEQLGGIYWSLNEAARQTGGNKGSISRHISEGKLQWHDRPEGKRLHAAEVMHFYGDRMRQRRNRVANTQQITTSEQVEQENNTPVAEAQQLETAVKLASAETEIRYLKEMLEVERERREKAEQEQDRWHTAYEGLKLLPPPTTQPANSNLPETPAATPQPIQKRSFWDRIAGR
jgi:hypothetical protein